MYLDIVILAVMIGWIARGNLKNLSSLPLKGIWIFVLLGAIGVLMKFTDSPDKRTIYQFLIMSFYAICLGLIWYNRHLPGMKLALIGLLLNFLVMGVNGGRMPVSQWAALVSGQAAYLPDLLADRGSRHVLLTAQTHLKFLGDIIPLPPPYPRNRVLSLGDVVAFVGIMQIIIVGMKKKK